MSLMATGGAPAWDEHRPYPDPQMPGWNDSWQRFHDAYQDDLVAYARRLLFRWRRPDLAARAALDVHGFLSTCFERSWLTREPDVRSFRAYVLVLFRRFLIGCLREKGGPPPPESGRDAERSPLAELLEAESLRTTRQRIAHALWQLRAGNRRYARVIACKLLEHRGDPALARARLEQLCPSRSARRVLVHRARRALARLLGERGGETTKTAA